MHCSNSNLQFMLFQVSAQKLNSSVEWAFCFTFPKFSYPIKNYFLSSIFQGSGIPIYEAVWEKMEPDLVTGDTLFSEESLKNVQKGKICLVHGHLILRAVLDDYFKKHARCNFHLSNNMFFPFPLLIPVKKSLPRKFKDKLNFG